MGKYSFNTSVEGEGMHRSLHITLNVEEYPEKMADIFLLLYFAKSCYIDPYELMVSHAIP